jgi:non-specific serine/threonine protein kinase
VHHSALVSAGNELYLVGGYAGSSFEQPTSAVHRFDAAAGGWVEAPPLPQARAAGAAAWDGTRILYGGGVGQDGLAGDVYALGGDGWQAIGTLSEPREHLGAAGDGQGRVWFVGGRRGGLDTNLGTVDLVDGDAVRRLGDLPTPRGGVAAFWSAPTGACLAGGEAPGGTFAEVECMDDTGGVRVLPDLATPRHGLGAAFVDGFAYILLGGPQPGLSTSGAVETLPISPGG